MDVSLLVIGPNVAANRQLCPFADDVTVNVLDRQPVLPRGCKCTDVFLVAVALHRAKSVVNQYASGAGLTRVKMTNRSQRFVDLEIQFPGTVPRQLDHQVTLPGRGHSLFQFAGPLLLPHLPQGGRRIRRHIKGQLVTSTVIGRPGVSQNAR